MEQETWNMATATLKRFDLLLKQSSFMAQTGNLPGWFHVLMDLRRNIYPFMPKSDWENLGKKFNSLPKGWKLPQNRIRNQDFAKISQTFDEIYMLIIKTMKDKGLLMPKALDTSEAIIQM